MGLSRGSLGWFLQTATAVFRKSHGLVPWIVRLVSTQTATAVFRKSHGLVPWIVRLVSTDGHRSLQEIPRACPVDC
jgi:hypothetical protein